MKKRPRIAWILFAAAALGSLLWSQQTKDQPEGVEERLTKLEERMASTEKVLSSFLEPATVLPEGAVVNRLMRLEDRLARLEANAQRSAPGAPGPNFDRMLEGRIRALEQEVARLRR